ncbi:hypothetical protein YC2023_024898 [Brassica napus]
MDVGVTVFQRRLCAVDSRDQMFSLDHYEWRMPRMHYGRRNTREYARRRHRDMEGNLVLPMFPDPEEQYMEFPFRYPNKQTVRRKVLMPHFQRMAMEERILQGNARFQLATEEEPPRKRGRPCKPPSAAGGPPKVFTGKCQCGVLIKNALEDRSVAGYTEDFINQAKLGVLEPLEFALVRRMAGFAMEADEKIAANVAALSSMEGGNPDGSEAAQGERLPGGVLGYGKRCQPKPAEEWCHLFRAGLHRDIREELVGVLEPLEFALVRRIANQALHAEEWLAEGEAEAEYDRVAEGDEDLGSETRYAPSFLFTNYCGPTPFKIPVELSCLKLKRSSAENSRRPETLAVELSPLLSCAASLSSLSLSPARCSLSPRRHSLSPRRRTLSLSSPTPCGGGGDQISTFSHPCIQIQI